MQEDKADMRKRAFAAAAEKARRRHGKGPPEAA
jgi:hypothetical protein